VKRPALGAVIILLAGCSTIEPEPAGCPRLPLPPAPTLPRIQPEALVCLSDSTYEALATRDAKMQAYAKQCRAVLLTTHAGAEKRADTKLPRR